MDACLGDRDSVQPEVELAVAAAVAPVAFVLAGARGRLSGYASRRRFTRLLKSR